MQNREEKINDLIIDMAEKIAGFASTIAPDIGFSNTDLTYAMILAVALIQKDSDFAVTILDECYTLIQHKT